MNSKEPSWKVFASLDETSNRRILRAEEIATGNSIEFVDWTAEPLGFSDLIAAPSKASSPITIKIANATIIDENGVRRDEKYSSKFVINSPYSSGTFALVTGGWIPAGVLDASYTVIPDRNAVSEIEARFRNGSALKKQSADLIDLIADQSIRINPLLYAMEGNKMAPPTAAEVNAQIIEAVNKIRLALPKATIIPDGLEGAKGIVGLISEGSEGLAKKTQFLISVAPRLMSPASRSKRQALWRWILDEADGAGLQRLSLPVLLALSALTTPQGNNVAKKILKPSHSYDTKCAYNALFDLRILELLIATCCLFPEQNPALLTRDKSLALFWSSIEARDMRYSSGALHYQLSLSTDLFPDVSDEEISMMQIIR